jgi:hypothetical protein
MARVTLDELKEAFEGYDQVRIRCSETGDWSQFADLFVEDAHYIEHAYGEMQGREAIREWIAKVMAPFPHMQFPQNWVVFDEKNSAVVFEVDNLLPHPTDPDHSGFGFASWTRLVYGGEGLWSSEEDVYNPARDAGRVIKAWRAAGGKFVSAEQVEMKDR